MMESKLIKAASRFVALGVAGFAAACTPTPTKEAIDVRLTREVVEKREVVALPEVIEEEVKKVGKPISLLLAPIAELNNRKVASVERKIAVARNARSARQLGKDSNQQNGPVVGVFDPESAGIPDNIWSNSQGVEALRTLIRIPNRIESPEVLDLVHTILGALVAPPKGSATFERFLRERITKIYELGFPATVVAISRSIPRNEQPQWLQELALRSMVATGLDGDVCRNASLIKKTPSTSAWLIRLRLVCVLFSQGPDEARKQLTRMTKTGQIADDDFAQLMRVALARNESHRVVSELKVHRDFEPEMLLLDLVQVTDQRDWFRRLLPAQQHRLINAEGLKVFQRMKIAEHAARAGTISGQELSQVYQAAISDAFARTDPVALNEASALPSAGAGAANGSGAANGFGRGIRGGIGSGGGFSLGANAGSSLPGLLGGDNLLRGEGVKVKPASFTQPEMKRAEYLWRAEQATDSRLRLEYIRRFLHESASANLTHAAAEAVLPILRKIPVISENLGGGDIAVFAALRAGELELASEWLSLIKRDPVAAQVIATRSVPLSYLELIGAVAGITDLPTSQNSNGGGANGGSSGGGDTARADDPTDPADPTNSDGADGGGGSPEARVQFTDDKLRSELRNVVIPRGRNLGLPQRATIRAILFALNRDLQALDLRESLQKASLAGGSQGREKDGTGGAGAAGSSSSERGQTSQARASDTLTRRLDELKLAVEQRRVGEAVAISSSMVPYLAGRPRIASAVIEALRRLDLEQQARAVALEILTANNRVL